MITSTANAQVKELVKLMKKSRARDEAGVFLVEGPRMAGELISDPDWRTKIEKIYLSESYAGKSEGERTAKYCRTRCSPMYPVRRRRRAYSLS